MHGKWERSNLEKYVQFDKKKWRYSDQDKDGMLNRQEYEYFHHPKEHEVMLTYVAVVSIHDTFSNQQLKSREKRLRFGKHKPVDYGVKRASLNLSFLYNFKHIENVLIQCVLLAKLRNDEF